MGISELLAAASGPSGVAAWNTLAAGVEAAASAVPADSAAPVASAVSGGDALSDAKMLFGLVHLAGVTTADVASVVLREGFALILVAATFLVRKQLIHPSAWRLPAILLAAHLALSVLRWALEIPPASAVGVIVVFLLLATIARAGFLLAIDWFLGKRLKSELPRILRDVIQVVVYVPVVLGAFGALGVEVGSLLTTSALLTAVIGLSLQETLGNLFAGLALQAQRSYVVGDWIHMGDGPASSIGKVVEIGWRATRVITNDLVEIVIPNGALAKERIENFSHPTATVRRLVTVQGPYEVAPHRVEAALMEAMLGAEGVVDHPRPSTWVSSYADSGIEYTAVFFIEDFARRPIIDSNVRRRIWYAFQRAGISIPFPIRDVRVQTTDAAQLLAGREARLAEIRVALARVEVLAELTEAQLESLSRTVATRQYVTGEVMVRQGDAGDELFVIESGDAAVLVAREGGVDDEVAVLHAGNVFGEMSLLTGEPRSATVRARTPTQVLVVGHASLQALLQQQPALVEALSRRLAERRAALKKLDDARATAAAAASESAVLVDRIRRFFGLRVTAGSSAPSRGPSTS